MESCTTGTWARGYAFNNTLQVPWSSPQSCCTAAFLGASSATTQAYDADALIALAEGPDGAMAHPTLDHFIPLLYCMGAARPNDPVSFPIAGWDMGSLSMRAVRFG